MKKTATVTRRKVTPVPENVTLNPAGQDLQAFSVLLDRWNREHSAGGRAASPHSRVAELPGRRPAGGTDLPTGYSGPVPGCLSGAEIFPDSLGEMDDWAPLDRAAARSAALLRSIDAMEVQIDQLQKELAEARRKEKRIAAEAVIQVMRRFRIGHDVVRQLVERARDAEDCLVG